MATERIVWDKGAVQLARRWGPIECRGSLFYMYDQRIGELPFSDQPFYCVLRFYKPRSDGIREHIYRARPTQAEILRRLRVAPRKVEEVNGVGVFYHAADRKFRASCHPDAKSLSEARAQAAAAGSAIRNG